MKQSFIGFNPIPRFSFGSVCKTITLLVCNKIKVLNQKQLSVERYTSSCLSFAFQDNNLFFPLKEEHNH